MRKSMIAPLILIATAVALMALPASARDTESLIRYAPASK